MSIVDCIIIFLLFAFILQINHLYHKRKMEKYTEKKEKEIAELNKVILQLSSKPLGNFESDMTFLMHCISHAMANFKLYTLKPRDTAGYKIIDDELFETWKEHLIQDIYKQLSPNYKKTLYLYFSHEGLMNYIVEKVNFEMIDMIISMKFSKK